METEFASEFDSSRSQIHGLLEQQGKAHCEKKLGKISWKKVVADPDLDSTFHIEADLDLQMDPIFL